MTFITFIILACATWRISSFLVAEDGPANIFARFRSVASKYTGLFECVWCTSVWVAMVLVLFVMIYPVLIYAYLPFAISTVAILIDRYSQ